MIVADVIEEAREIHPSFDDRTATDRLLRRQLARKAQSLLEKAIGRYPDPFLTCVFELDLPLGDFTDGEPFPESLFARGGRVTYDGGGIEDLAIVDHANLLAPPVWPACSIVGGHIYLCGTEEAWTGAGANLATVFYAPVLEELDDNDAVLDPLPEYALEPLVAELAVFMARRANVGVTDLLGERDTAIKTFLHTVAGHRRAVTSRIRRVI